MEKNKIIKQTTATNTLFLTFILTYHIGKQPFTKMFSPSKTK